MVLDQFCEHEHAYIGNGSGEVHPITGFDYDELFRRCDGEPEEETSAAQYAEALIGILTFVVGDKPIDPDSPFGIASRAIGLLWMLRPDLTPGFKGLTDIATHCAVTKQAISKSLAELKCSANWTHARHFKGSDSTGNYRAGAKRGWKRRLERLRNREESEPAQALSEADVPNLLARHQARCSANVVRAKGTPLLLQNAGSGTVPFLRASPKNFLNAYPYVQLHNGSS
jgi:hypothetical protein